jgi:hypothetical protein
VSAATDMLLPARPGIVAASRNGIEVVEVGDRRGLDAFIAVAEELNRDEPNWVAPLRVERRKAFDRSRNPYFAHADAAFWIAQRDGRALGRISAQIDRLWLERYGDRTGHFGLFESSDDADVTAALLGAAETWLRGRGMSRALGPLSLSINQESGLLVDGFDTPPMLMMGHAQPHLGMRLTEAGYQKAVDLYAYRYDLGAPMLPDAPSMLARSGRSRRIVVRPLHSADYGRDVAAALEILNDAWADNWGFVPLTPDEMAYTAREMRPLVSERLVWFAEVDGEPAAMIIALANLNEAIEDLKGRLAPFGWLKLLWRLKLRKFRSGRVALMGVKRKYASTLLGKRLPFLLIEALRREGQALGYRYVELSWVLEQNLAMQRIIEAAGGRRYKTYRLFEKGLV